MLEPITEVWKSIQTNIRERSGSALYGCILITWLALNWKPIAIFIFSNEDIYLKIRAISHYYSSDKQFWTPVLYGSVIAIAFPVLNAIYGFIEIITLGLIKSKNNLLILVNAIAEEIKLNYEIKVETLKRVRDAEIEYNIQSKRQQVAQAEINAKLTEEGLSSLDNTIAELARLQKLNEEQLLEIENLKNHPFGAIDKSTETEIKEYLMTRRYINQHIKLYNKADFSDLTDK